MLAQAMARHYDCMSLVHMRTSPVLDRMGCNSLIQMQIAPVNPTTYTDSQSAKDYTTVRNHAFGAYHDKNQKEVVPPEGICDEDSCIKSKHCAHPGHQL